LDFTFFSLVLGELMQNAEGLNYPETIVKAVVSGYSDFTFQPRLRRSRYLQNLFKSIANQTFS
jgi:hypothetical protein